VTTDPLVTDWPGDPSFIVFRMTEGFSETIAAEGDLEEVRQWASVSKMAVSLAFGVEVDWGFHQPSETFGPRGATLANLLSHSSGLGLEENDPVVGVATKRVYSNFGIDYAVNAIMNQNEPSEWLRDRVFSPLGMNATKLNGRPSSGVEGSTRDMRSLAEAWLRPDGITKETRNRFITPYVPNLDGIVPGFGRFSPCPWGLGPEVRGQKEHWMGDWPPESFGHFGQSGALMLLNVEEGIGVVATSTVDFGPWAVQLWPGWTSAVRKLALAS
jgi:CubicO group peptidase (beta-lactamase class C family)